MKYNSKEDVKRSIRIIKQGMFFGSIRRNRHCEHNPSSEYCTIKKNGQCSQCGGIHGIDFANGYNEVYR